MLGIKTVVHKGGDGGDDFVIRVNMDETNARFRTKKAGSSSKVRRVLVTLRAD